MRCWVILIVATATIIPAMVRGGRDETNMIDNKLLKSYLEEMQGYLDQGKSWPEIDDIMDISWPPSDERYRPPSPESKAKARQADTRTDQQKVNDIVKLLHKRLSEDQLRLERHPTGPQQTKYTLPIIRYVANLDDDALKNLDKDDKDD